MNFRTLVLSSLLLAGASAWSADDAAVWREECGSCHVAYPARFLPAASWDQLMRTLDRHFGVDATLDEATAARIRGYLTANARRQPAAPSSTPVLRITELPWFKREHDEVPATLWRSAQVKTPANCAACHRNADAGRFSEHDLNVPGGFRHE